MTYSQHFQTKKTSQSEPIPGTKQVKNNAGGYVWGIDDWDRLDRFLVLGSEGGSYYVNKQELTIRNANAVTRCLKENGIRVVDRAIEISEGGRAAKNDAAIFVMAMAMSPSFADDGTRAYASHAIGNRKVARIGTHLFSFVEEMSNMRGWGRTARRSVRDWYGGMSVGELAYQVTKYQQRGGWAHRDLLRLSHPRTDDPARNAVYKWATSGWSDAVAEDAPQLIIGVEAAKGAKTDKEIVTLIEKYGLTREMVPTRFLNSVAVWEKLLDGMPMFALIRNLGKMTSIGLLAPLSEATKYVVGRFTDGSYWDQNWAELKYKAPHPYALLVALKTYQLGHGVRGKLTWDTVGNIVDALDEAYYKSFGAVVPTGKNIMLALDVSGSMRSPMVQGSTSLPIQVREAAAAMAMATARVEQNYFVTIFSSAGKDFMKSTGPGASGWGYQEHGISSFDISPRERLDDILRKTHRLPFGGTDCALPMLYATKLKIPVDMFVIYTDHETWSGNVHPAQALNEYRNKMGIPAKLATVAMTSSGFSIADPNDSGMMDVIGFSTDTPQVISNFAVSNVTEQ